MSHYDPDHTEQHFFATCAFGWESDPSPYAAIDRLKKAYKRHLNPEAKNKGLYVALFHVPVGPKKPYQINYFAPQVEGTTKVWEGRV